MRMAHGNPAPADNVQTAVDSAHGIIVAQEVTTEAADNRSLVPMAEAAKQALDNPETLNVVADAGYRPPRIVFIAYSITFFARSVLSMSGLNSTPDSISFTRLASRSKIAFVSCRT